MGQKNALRIFWSLVLLALSGLGFILLPRETMQTGSNLVLNPSFETAGAGGAADAANWREGVNHARADDKFNTGSWSLKSSFISAGGTSTRTAAIAVSPNTVYTYSGYLWRASTSGGSCMDMNDILGERQLCTVTTGSWQFLSGTWNSGANTSVILRLITDGTPNESVWFDDISLAADGPTATATGTNIPGPTPTQGADLIVAGAGDIACNAGSPGAACKQMETSDLLVSINPDKVLAFGDNQYEQGALSDFQNFYDPSWGRLKSNTSPAVGNHEYLTNGAAGYYSYFGAAAGDPSKGYYSYDLGGWHLIALNSNCSQIGGCATGSPEYIWLQNDLNANPALCTIAYMHHPLWASSSSYATPSVQPFVQLLYDKGVELLLAGHAHNYERFARQNANGGVDPAYGIREMVIGTGGRNFTSFGTIALNSEVRNATAFGVIKLTLRAGDYTWQFMPIAGSSFTDGPVTETCHAAHP